MKAIATAVVGVLIFICTGPVSADTPDIEEAVYIYDGSDPMEAYKTLVPVAVDWNNDGLKDLVVGQYTDGYIWLYLNQGTDINPVFDGGTLIESNGAPITTSYY